MDCQFLMSSAGNLASRCRCSMIWAISLANANPPSVMKILDYLAPHGSGPAPQTTAPDAHELEVWAETHNLVERVRACAHGYLDAVFRQLKERLDGANVRWSRRAFEDLRELGEEITVAYG